MPCRVEAEARAAYRLHGNSLQTDGGRKDLSPDGVLNPIMGEWMVQPQVRSEVCAARTRLEQRGCKMMGSLPAAGQHSFQDVRGDDQGPQDPTRAPERGSLQSTHRRVGRASQGPGERRRAAGEGMPAYGCHMKLLPTLHLARVYAEVRARADLCAAHDGRAGLVAQDVTGWLTRCNLGS